MAQKLAIFDLDGTLLDTIGDLAEACNYMLSLRNLGSHTREEYAKMVGNGILNLVKRALHEEFRSEEYVMAARADFLDYYTSNIDLYTHPYDGIREVLHALQDDGWSLAVASNKFDEGTQKLVQTIFPEVAFKAVYGKELPPSQRDKNAPFTILNTIEDSKDGKWGGRLYRLLIKLLGADTMAGAVATQLPIKNFISMSFGLFSPEMAEGLILILHEDKMGAGLKIIFKGIPNLIKNLGKLKQI
jgi:phosphoglycolate phosphatase-like HAD superfamily hydrolase